MGEYILKRAEWLAKDEAELKAIAELKALEAFERKAMGNAESEGYAMEEAERTAMQKEAEEAEEAANLARMINAKTNLQNAYKARDLANLKVERAQRKAVDSNLKVKEAQEQAEDLLDEVYGPGFWPCPWR